MGLFGRRMVGLFLVWRRDRWKNWSIRANFLVRNETQYFLRGERFLHGVGGRLIGKRGSRRAANKSTTVMMQIMLSLMVQPVIENQERYLAKLRFVYVRVPLIPRVPLRRTSQLRWKDNFHIANQRVENLEKSIYLHWDSTWILTYKIAQSNKRLTTKPLRLLQKMWLTPTYLEGL